MYNKKVLSKATAGLDKAKAPAKKKDIIVDPMGQWKHPGQNTRIPSSNITMQGVNYPVLGVGSNGQQQMMYPGMEYTFPGADYVDEFPQMQEGGGMNAMMKARLAYADMHGNPAAKRMINLPDNPYDFGNGNTGTHYMASMDNYAVPQIQDENGQLMLGDYGPDSNEAMKFDSPEDAEYFAEHYKDIAPGFIEADLTDDEIEEYRKGGYIVEDISVPELTKAQNGYVVPTRADSLLLYNNAIDKSDFYKKNKYKKGPFQGTNFKDPKVRKELINEVKTNQAALRINPNVIEDLKNETGSNRWDKYKNENRFKKVKGTNVYSFGDILGNTVNTYYNPESPTIYLHQGISPQGSIMYHHSGRHFEDASEVPYYDPLAIKPGDMLTPAEVKARVKKYGTRGIPVSKLKSTAPPIGGKNPLVTMPSGAKLGAKKKVVNDPYAHSKTNVVPTIIGTPPDQNNDPTKKYVGANEVVGYDEKGNPIRTIEHIYEDIKLTKGLKDLSEFTNPIENEIVPQTFPIVDPQKTNTAFRYRDQWQHVYKPVEGDFKTFGTKPATLPYGEKLGEHPWEYNKSNELPESGHHVWIVGDQKYYNEQEAKAAAEQWDKDNSYQFQDGGTLPEAQLGKNVSLTASPFSLNANAIPLASKVFGEYNPELLLGAQQNLKSTNQDFKHNATVDLGLPYTGKFAPSVNAAYHGAYDLSTPGQKLRPTVNSDLQVGYHPKQGVNFAVTANPRLEFSNVGQDTLNRKNWSQGAWKGYVGLLGSVGYRGKSFDPNNIQGVPASWATVDPKGGNFLMGFGANAGFEARPFKKPLKLGIDASLMESHGKKSAEQTVDSSPHNYTGWTPTVNVHASYPLSELMRKKQNKTREPNLPKNRPSGVHKFQEGGKLGPIHLNEGRKTIRDYVYGADIGMLQEQQGGYIDTELTDEEIQAYRDAGYDVEELG